MQKFISLAENISKGKLCEVHGVCFFASLPKIYQPLEVGVSGWHKQTDRLIHWRRKKTVQRKKGKSFFKLKKKNYKKDKAI